MAGLGEDGQRIQVGLENPARGDIRAGHRSQQLPEEARLAAPRLRPAVSGVDSKGQQRRDIPGGGRYRVEQGAIPGEVGFS
ncbi:hypothetical protein GCM10009712_22990 [Pseudarthrobacter sulfonivorans]